MKRKIISMVVMATMLLGSGVGLAASSLNKWISKDGSIIDEGKYPIYVNGKKLDMKDVDTGKDQTQLVYNGRIYVPLRKVAEAVEADKNKMWDISNPNSPIVNIVTPEHSKPTDYIQKNIFPNGVLVSSAVKTNDYIISEAKRITENKQTKQQKAYAIYEFIIDNMQYFFLDEDGNGMPDMVGAEFIIESGFGICYDYASLYAVMCDAVGLNVRLIGGYAQQNGTGGYHAWNEIQLDNGNWINVDPTWGESNKSLNFGFKTSELNVDTNRVADGRYSDYMFAEFENY